MKIIQLCTDLGCGGVPRFVLDLAQELGKSHEVILATHYPASHDQMSVPQPNFRRIAFDKQGSGISLPLMGRICQWIASEKPDVLHTHLFSLLYAAPLIAFHVPRKTRFIHTIHSMADVEMPSIDFLRKRWYSGWIKAVAISRPVQQSVADYFPGTKVPLIVNGVSANHETADPLLTNHLNALRKSEKTKIFLNIGHLNDCKNQLMLNEAGRRLKEDGYDFQIVIVGNANAEYEREFNRVKIDQIHYWGRCNAISTLLRAADFFTLSSRFEGMPISLLEALREGCVPVCVPAGGIPDACINHQTGILAAENSIDALYHAMRDALELSLTEYSHLRKQAKELFHQEFTMTQCASSYLKLYQCR